ncbi:MAG: hypothetical protein QOI62_3658 [Solirubrobacteraceae bacterium]|nr:hypothetical protein [Solirubrobacteraceae bacterium]MEA2275855.1 hypothetical protein [Solirubrobacteraceae bacterium]MEA2360398.1 hypothetical protein [Solirubrobacteraceae bacterium]
MTSLAWGLALALVASVALNASYLLQHAGSTAGAIEITPRRPVATLASLLRSPLWALGAVLGVTGWALHVGALSRAPLSLVQAFVAGGLALTVPMAAIGLGHRARPDERRAAGLMVAALVLLSLGLHGAGRHAAYSPVVLGGYLAALGAVAAVLAVADSGARRAAALGLAGGTLYGAADLAIKALTRHGVGSALTSPWVVAAALATIGAFFAFQRGLQLGRPVTVIALMTAATNVTSIAGGFVVFGDPLGRTPLLAVLHAIGFGLVAVAAWRLAPSQASLTAGTLTPAAGASEG